MAARLAQVPRPLAILLALALVEMVAWTFAIAPLQGPDESAHVAYVQHLAETGKAPSRNDGEGTVSTEQAAFTAAHNLFSLVGNPTARPAWTDADVEARERIAADPPAEPRDDGSGPNATGQNPPLYYAYEALPYLVFTGADFATRLEAMRLWSGLLVIPVVLFTWLVAGELFGRRRFPQTLATGVVALHPQVSHVTAVVTADAMLAPLWAAGVYVAIRLVRHGPSPPRVAAMAGLAAAASLTHGRGLALVVPALLAIAIAAWRHRVAWRRALVVGGLGLGIVAAGLLATVLLTTSSSGSAFGGQIDQTADTTFRVRQLLSYVWQFYLPKLPFMVPMIGPPYGYDQVFVRTFFGTFGSLDVTIGETAFDLLKLATTAGLIGLAIALIARRRALRPHWPLLLVLASFPVALLGELHVVAYRELLHTPDPIITGRYLVPLITLFAVAVTFTVTSLPRRVAVPVAALVLASGAVLQITALGHGIARFYG